MKRPLRILELRSVRGTGGGPEKTILLGARRADPRRFAVTACYLRDLRDRDFGVTAQAAGAGVDYVEIHERHSFDPAIWPALRRLVRDRSIDIVHAHEYKTDFLALMLARVEGIAPLATVHGWSGQTSREKLYYAADKRLLARFPRVIAVSRQIKDVLVEHGAKPERVSVVRNSIDPLAFRRRAELEGEARAALAISTDATTIGAVGRLEPEKRFDLLLEAFATVRGQNPRVTLLVAGEGAARKGLEALAMRLGLGPACRFLGYHRDVIGLHHALDLFVQSSDREGTPNAVLEAMALGTPVVATAVGGTTELIDPDVHGLLVPRGDAALLARAIERALADRPASAARAAAARARVERELSFDVRMAAVDRVYEELAVSAGRAE